MTIELATMISLISLGFAGLMAISTLKRNSRIDTQQGTSDITRISVRLENIETGVSEIKCSMKEIRDDAKNFHDRLVRVEEAAKSAHKRIDEIRGRGNE